jgi:hypothetical protein
MENQNAFAGALKSELKRAPAPQGNNELAALNQMLAQLNDPTLELLTPSMIGATAAENSKTGASAPAAPDEFSAPAGANGATIALSDPVFGNVPAPGAPAPEPVAQATAPGRTINTDFILLTGRSGAGKDYVAGRVGRPVQKLDTLILKLCEEAFGRHPEAALVGILDAVTAWGRGTVSAKYPLTPARLTFCLRMQEVYPDFGMPSFWTDRIANNPDFSKCIVPGVADPEDFKRLTAEGYMHFHVVCSNATFAQRPKKEWVDNSLAIHLDKQIQARINSPGQDKLRVIWSDTAPCPSKRFYTVDEFVALMKRLYTVDEFVALLNAAPAAVTGE